MVKQITIEDRFREWERMLGIAENLKKDRDSLEDNTKRNLFDKIILHYKGEIEPLEDNVRRELRANPELKKKYEGLAKRTNAVFKS